MTRLDYLRYGALLSMQEHFSLSDEEEHELTQLESQLCATHNQRQAQREQQ